MQGIIVYKSTYGSTKQYAEWLSQQTGFQAVPVAQVNDTILDASDAVIVGCPVLKFQPALKTWLTKKWPILKEKQVMLFTTSGAPSNHPKLQAGYKESFSEAMQQRLAYFPLGGRMVYQNLKPIHKLLMNIGQRLEKNPQAKAEMMKDVDHVHPDAIAPILDYVTTLEKA